MLEQRHAMMDARIKLKLSSTSKWLSPSSKGVLRRFLGDFDIFLCLDWTWFCGFEVFDKILLLKLKVSGSIETIYSIFSYRIDLTIMDFIISTFYWKFDYGFCSQIPKQMKHIRKIIRYIGGQ